MIYSTKPLSYNGNIIPEFNLTFKDGKVVDYDAEINKEGKYKANGKTIIYSGSSTEDNLQDEEFEYLVDEDNIILTESSLVYRKQVNNNEK